MLYVVLAAALVGLDQLVKFLVRANIPMGEGVPFLPHVLQLTYYQNTGAAFSIFEEHTWFSDICLSYIYTFFRFVFCGFLFSVVCSICGGKPNSDKNREGLTGWS